MIGRRIGLSNDILKANVADPRLPYRMQLVATYKCNFRCEMCSIWKKHSVDEMTPAEVAQFFDRWSGFRWVNLSGGEIFMRRDIDDVVRAIQENCRSLFMINFPTTGWFGDRTVALANQILDRGIGRLMITISIDGPKETHEQLRGLLGSWERGIETYRRLRGIRRGNFQPVVGMTLLAKNVMLVDETIAAIQRVIPDFTRSELHLNVGHESAHYFENTGYTGGTAHETVLAAMERHRRAVGASWHPVAFLENRYQALLAQYFQTGKSPLPCTALATNCFIDAHWNLYPCSIWDEKVGNLREAGFDLDALWTAHRTRALRKDVVNENCPHCWTPCEAYPTILANLVRSIVPARRPASGS
ncbi:MAG TPA: radical SAM protein [Vicinamibacterales bacterium]